MQMRKQMSIGLIGAGNMGDALIRGLLGQRLLPPTWIWVTNRSNRERLQALQTRYGVRITPTKPPLLDAATVVILAVKPKDMPVVFDEIGGTVRQDQLILSVAAGVPISAIERALPEVPVIRAMPNTSAAVQASATAIAPGAHARDDHMQIATRIFQAVGDVVSVSEEVLDAVTGLSGSGPAYVYRFTEALIDAGTDLGLSAALAKRLTVQTLLGAARMLAESEVDPAELRRRVTSPGGTTMAGLSVLETRGFAATISDAVHSAVQRARELTREHGRDPMQT
jgi:pyrroline-5-carboxylate reductase